MKYGVYISNKTAKLKVLSPHTVHDHLIVLDEGIKKIHPQLRMIKVHVVVKECSKGFPLHEYDLKSCEYLGEL